MNLANFICRRCIKTGSDKTPTGCASKLETVRRFGTVPTTLLPLYFRDDAYNLRLIERVTIEWEFFRWILHSALSILRGTRVTFGTNERNCFCIYKYFKASWILFFFYRSKRWRKMQYYYSRTFQNLRAQAVATPCRAFLSYLGLP